MKDLINKAKERGFPYEKIFVDKYEHEFARVVESDDYLWMCLLQKWLRDVHFLNIVIDYNQGFGWVYAIKHMDRKHDIGNFVQTYEQALEEALTKAMELI